MSPTYYPNAAKLMQANPSAVSTLIWMTIKEKNDDGP